MQDLFGGSNSNTNSSSGFALLPQQVQTAINTLASNATSELGNGNNANLFAEPNLNAGATSALQQLSNSSFAPTASSINSDISEQMNPYNSDVISQINKNAYGADSALASQLSTAGQFGTNRAALGANDIATTQANEIGSLLNPEYNTALNNALTVIPQAQTTAATNAVGAGQTQQQIQQQQQLAPISALQAFAQIVGALPQNGGSTSSSSTTTSNGIIPGLKGL